MFVFFLDLYTDIDAISPIIYKLNKKNKGKVLICSTNYIQNNYNNKLIKVLRKQGVKYVSFPTNNFYLTLFTIFQKILTLLPKKILGKFRFLFKFFYYKFTFFNKKEIVNFLQKHNAKIVSIDSSNPVIKIEKISQACKKININLIFIPSGAEIIDVKIYNISNDFKFCSYYLSQNILEKFKVTKYIKNQKIKFLGSPRYCNEWLNFIKKYNEKKNKDVNNRINLGFFVTPPTQNFPKHSSIVNLLKKDKRFNVKIRNKPRDYMPEKCCSYIYDELNTSEIINWSDIIITVQSSVIIEAIKKNKLVFFLEYLIPKNYGTWPNKFKCVQVIKSEKDLLQKIRLIKKNNLNFKIKNKKEYLKKVVGIDTKSNNVLTRYVKFYKSIS